MIANKLTILTATAALLEPALALGHRHAHQQHAQKRGEWITATINGQVVSWENNYYGPGGAPPAATQPAAASHPEAPAAPAPAPAQPTTIIKVAKPSQAAKPAYKPAQPKKEDAAAVPKPAIKEKTQSKAAKSGGSSGAPSGLSHKRGLAYNNGALANTFAQECKDCGWGYSWEADTKGFNALTFIPTLLKNDPIFTSTFDDYCAKALDNGAPAIFSFNEPDIPEQAGLTTTEAVQLHQQYLNPYSGKALIGAPSVTNSGEPNKGLAWLKSWISECNGECKFDFCNVHWYSDLQYASTLFDHLKAAHEACEGKPIWLTEFGPTDLAGTPADVLNSWLEETIPKLEALDYLHAYSYFKLETGYLMSSNSQLSGSGKVYASA